MKYSHVFLTRLDQSRNNISEKLKTYMQTLLISITTTYAFHVRQMSLQIISNVIYGKQR